jgi:hypothetical protein
LIASANPIDDSVGNELSFVVQEVDLKPYLMTETYTLIVKTTKDQVTTEDYVVKLDAQFQVDANILGF